MHIPLSFFVIFFIFMKIKEALIDLLPFFSFIFYLSLVFFIGYILYKIFEKIYSKTELSVKNNFTALKKAIESENEALNNMKHFRVGSTNYNALQQKAMSWADKRIKAEAKVLADEVQKKAKILADEKQKNAKILAEYNRKRDEMDLKAFNDLRVNKKTKNKDNEEWFNTDVLRYRLGRKKDIFSGLTLKSIKQVSDKWCRI